MDKSSKSAREMRTPSFNTRIKVWILCSTCTLLVTCALRCTGPMRCLAGRGAFLSELLSSENGRVSIMGRAKTYCTGERLFYRHVIYQRIRVGKGEN